MPSAVFWFPTKAFVDSAAERDQRVNENIGGASLANWLSSQLKASGFVSDEPIAEDHGWDFEVRDGAGRYTLVCTIEDNPDDEREACIQVHLGKPGRTALDSSDPVYRCVKALIEAQGTSFRID